MRTNYYSALARTRLVRRNRISAKETEAPTPPPDSKLELATAELKNSAASARQERASWLPSLTEIVFVSVLAWLFLLGAGPTALLGDGDTGWHIRTGEHILATRSFPTQDLFSFSRAGDTWYAWEWLSGVLLAAAHKMGGLAGVVLLAGVVIAATSAVVFRHMLSRGANVVVAILVMLVAGSASTIHWLARPHIFSYLLLAIAVWWLEADRRRPTRWVFGLAGLSIVWTNIHGGFGALLATIGAYLAGSVIVALWTPRGERNWAEAKRYALLLGLCLAASLINPYTYRLHQHIFAYLRSDFILNHVQEFRAPDFRGWGMRYFELLLLAGLACVPGLIRRRDVSMALLLLLWAHAALTSARHILLYVVVAAPIVAEELSRLWDEAAERGVAWLKTLQEVARDYGAGHYGTAARPAVGWAVPLAVVAAGVVLLTGQHHERLRAEFPKLRFPVDAVQAAEGQLAGRKIFTSDQWGDYLIYRYYPDLKVFIDGRSDFYGEDIAQQYLRASHSHHEWEKILDRWGFDLALLPVEWPLATTIKTHPDWKVKYDDGKALLLERTGAPRGENAAALRAGGPRSSGS